MTRRRAGKVRSHQTGTPSKVTLLAPVTKLAHSLPPSLSSQVPIEAE